jgi:hypothetical protein
MSADSDFLDRLASHLKTDKGAACRRAIERMHAVLKSNYEAGKYSSQTEAELDFIKLVNERETETCREDNPASKGHEQIEMPVHLPLRCRQNFDARWQAVSSVDHGDVRRC